LYVYITFILKTNYNAKSISKKNYSPGNKKTKLNWFCYEIALSFEMVESYFNQVSNKLTNEILNVLAEAWDNQ